MFLINSKLTASIFIEIKTVETVTKNRFKFLLAHGLIRGLMREKKKVRTVLTVYVFSVIDGQVKRCHLSVHKKSP